MRFAKICWSGGSILINVTIAIYIYLQSKAPALLADRLSYVNENWGIYGSHWKAEFLIMTLIAVGAFYFAVCLRKVEWVIITTGQFILLFTYPVMIGGYHNASLEVGIVVNQIATFTFVFGNMIFLTGLLYLYGTDTILKSAIRYASLAITVIPLITFFIIFIDIISWDEAVVVAPLINCLYLINAFYGYKLT